MVTSPALSNMSSSESREPLDTATAGGMKHPLHPLPPVLPSKCEQRTASPRIILLRIIIGTQSLRIFYLRDTLCSPKQMFSQMLWGSR